jgi:hypothetical protein
MMSNRLARGRFRSRVFRYPFAKLRHRGLRPHDAFLVSYPRSGTTWLRFLLSQALTGQPAGFDPANQPVPYVGEHGNAPAILPGGGRIIFSHETIPVGDRAVIYVARDPRAVALSEFRWLERRGLAPSNLDRFLAEFVRGRSNPWGSWGDHVSTWLESEAAANGRLHLVKFEDLSSSTTDVLSGVLGFLGQDRETAVIERAVRDNTFERMKEKEDVAPSSAFAKGVDRRVRFVRSGAVGGWQTVLTPQQRALIESAFDHPAQALGYEFGEKRSP